MERNTEQSPEKQALDLCSKILHDQCTAMQAAWIEWKHGKGADAAMLWIQNTLWGPGLIPDEDAPWGRDAQMWFNANRAEPFPVCHCGRPSHILRGAEGYCCQEHANDAALATSANLKEPQSP
jgi:hypothetical protein